LTVWSKAFAAVAKYWSLLIPALKEKAAGVNRRPLTAPRPGDPAAGDLMPHPRNSTQKADSEIFNKFGRSIESGRCTMRNHDFVSNGFLALIVAGLLLLCSILVVIGLR
jgi:hypothetical protein